MAPQNRNAGYGHFLGVRVSRELTSFRFGAEESVLCGDHAARKYSWTSWIAVAPSPTADATRLTERQRASPTANTPGMLVSKKKRLFSPEPKTSKFPRYAHTEEEAIPGISILWR